MTPPPGSCATVRGDRPKLGTTKARVVKGDRGHTPYYPGRADLLDRKALVNEVNRLERKLRGISLANAGLENEHGHVMDLEARAIHDRRLTMQLERAVFASYRALLSTLEKYDQFDRAQHKKKKTSRDASRLRHMAQRLLDLGLGGGGGGGGVDEEKEGVPPPMSERTCISEDVVRAYVETGAALAQCVEEALFADVVHETELEHATDLAVEHEKETRIALDREVGRLRQREQAYEAQIAYQHDEIALLRAKLAQFSVAESRERQALLRERVDRREFRDTILELLGELSNGIHRRLGFLPASTRNELNAFIANLAQLDADDANLLLLPNANRATSLHRASPLLTK